MVFSVNHEPVSNILMQNPASAMQINTTFDLRRPENAVEGCYLWLPVTYLEDGTYEIRYRKEWDFSVFDG